MTIPFDSHQALAISQVLFLESHQYQRNNAPAIIAGIPKIKAGSSAASATVWTVASGLGARNESGRKSITMKKSRLELAVSQP
jgi:hypothetical protein